MVVEGDGSLLMGFSALATVGHLVIALDLDGTLIPFAATPHQARLDGDSAALLDALAELPAVSLGIVSGRPRDLPA